MSNLLTDTTKGMSPDQALLNMQCAVMQARLGAVWRLDDAGVMTAAATMPADLASDPQAQPIFNLLRDAAVAGARDRGDHVVRLTPETGPVAGDAKAGPHAFINTIRRDDMVVAVATVLTATGDDAAQNRAKQAREITAGLFGALVSAPEDDSPIRAAIAMLAVAQDAEGFKGACLNLVNEVARERKCDRVSLGWIKRHDVRVVAMSDTDDLKSHSDEVAMLEPAMAECLDQQQTVVYPVPQGAAPLLMQAVVHSHRRIAETGRRRHVLTVPLRDKDELLGAITLEREDTPFDPGEMRYLQMVADVLAINLRDRRASDRWLVGHVWHSVEWVAGYMVGPRHVGWKLLGILVSVLLIATLVVKMPYKVTAPFLFEAERKRVVNAPFEAELAQVHVEQGDNVTAGDPLATFDVTELELQLAEAKADQLVSEREMSQARAEADWAKVRQLEARVQELTARIDLLSWQIDNAVIRAPIDGVVLVGSWKDKIGRVVDRKEAMFEVADLSELVAVLRVDESDIDVVHAARENLAIEERARTALTGTLTTRSQPGIKMNFEVRRIIPAASPDEGNNAVQVRAAFPAFDPAHTYENGDTVMFEGQRYRYHDANASLIPKDFTFGSGAADATAASKVGVPGEDADWQEIEWIRPGMEGIARIDVGREPIIWVATHKLTDIVRLWVWW